MSLVPITATASRDAGSRAVRAIASALNIASGVSSMIQSFVWSGAPAARSAAAASITSRGVDTFGTSTPSGAAAATAAMSSLPHAVPSPLMRITTSRLPKPPPVTGRRDLFAPRWL